MLDYAQSRQIEVSFGEWGHQSNSGISDINLQWIENSVKFLNHLVNERGYSCIKTVNIINEPNGNWAWTQGSYSIWKTGQDAYVVEMAHYAVSGVKLMGPDVAIFDSTNEIEWITKANNDLGEQIGLYRITSYNVCYTKLLRASL